MTSAYQQLFVGLAFAIVLIYLLIVVNFQSWLDPFVIVAALRHRWPGSSWMLFATGTTCRCRRSPARSCAWRRHREQHPGHRLRPVSAWRPEPMRWLACSKRRDPIRPVLMTGARDGIGMLPDAIEPDRTPRWPRRDRRPDLRHLRHAVLVPALFSLVHSRDRNTAVRTPTAPPSRPKADSHEESKPRRLLLIGLVALGIAGAVAAKGIVQRAQSAQEVARWTEQQAVPTVNACQARARRHQPASDAARHDPGLLQGGDLRPGQRLSEELEPRISGSRQGRAELATIDTPTSTSSSPKEADLATATANAQLAAVTASAEHTRHVAMGVAPGGRQQERRGSLDEGRDGRGQR